MDEVITGRVVTPSGVIEQGWVGIVGQTIAAVGQGEPPAATRRFDAPDSYIFPGIVDGQTHAGSYLGLPGLESTTRSAIAGGVTTIVDMPYDSPAPLNSVERLNDKIAAIQAYAYCDVALYGTIMPNQDVSEVAPLIEGGICAFKVSTFESSPTRFPRIAANSLLDLFEALAPTAIPLGVHNEDQEIVLARMAAARAAGHNGIGAHSASRPPAAELVATAGFLEMGAAAGAHAHIVHLSMARGFEIVDHYLQDGYRATGETCVHYLWFDPETDGETLGALMKVNPPIRPGQRDALWAEVAAGRVAFVSSDHSSWPKDNKNRESIFDAGAGVPGLETLLPAFFTGAQERGLDAVALTAEQLCERPARFFGLWPTKGGIQPGADADLTLFTPGDMIWDSARQHDDLNWSPYDGRRFAGRVTRTYLRGALAWDAETVLNAPGSGQYAPRTGSGWFE
jgi:allantoinase